MPFFGLNKITLSLLLLFITTLIGAAGFCFIDEYPFIDALYMAVITITTVGFGEIYPLSEWGRLFTIVLILLGFIVLGFVGHSIVESLLEKVWSGNAGEKRMKKQISLLTGHTIICGFGRVGEVASEHLREAGTEFVVIDSLPGLQEKCLEKGVLFIEGDATREVTLLEAGVKNASGLLALVDSDPLNLFIVLTARELNPTLHIIARSEERHRERKIIRAGADSIISPFDSAGKQIATDLLTATGVNQEPTVTIKKTYPMQEDWIAVDDQSELKGKSIGEIAALKEARVLGVRRGATDQLHPDEAFVVEAGDELLLLQAVLLENTATRGQPETRKIVIIDDNPVIIRLFSRLFQKEGYHPLTAATGEEGYKLIVEEKPVAAVIDYRLPGISGLELCQMVQKCEQEVTAKLIVFTAENDKELQLQCYAAGAEAVIVKSADAQEIIHTVNEVLNNKYVA
ncbi:MAG: hypothetical protein CSB34_06380 [Desulfobulbus propionicus]|nr:MAG: hypothetical protein CSB34_06380 [Desulfobulbus propionicus]